MVRYADDFVILCRSQSAAEQALEQVRQWCEAEGLTLHPTKTRIVDVRAEGFDFLGVSLPDNATGPPGALAEEEERMEAQGDAAYEDETGERSQSASDNCEVNETLRGWF